MDEAVAMYGVAQQTCNGSPDRYVADNGCFRRRSERSEESGRIPDVSAAPQHAACAGGEPCPQPFDFAQARGGRAKGPNWGPRRAGTLGRPRICAGA